MRCRKSLRCPADRRSVDAPGDGREAKRAGDDEGEQDEAAVTG